MGNDVVDLKEPGNRGKSADGRFLDRVCTAGEQVMIAAARSPDALVWSLWAAKEAAYKAIGGEDSSVCSIPRRYPVFFDGGTGDPGPDGILAGRVATPRGDVALRITVTEEYVHAVAAGSPSVLAGIIERVECMDGIEAPGDESSFVRRRLVDEMARRLGCPAGELAVLKDPPGSDLPRLFLRGRPLALDISLSHDGRFAAFVAAFH